jgi:hypothetical protein
MFAASRGCEIYAVAQDEPADLPNLARIAVRSAK